MARAEFFSGKDNCTEVRQDRCGPHTLYYPHHPAFENYQQRRRLANQRTNSGEHAEDPPIAKL